MYFITGCNGFIGSYIVRKLLAERHQVVALRRSHSDMSLIKDIQHQIQWIEGDIDDILLLRDTMQKIPYVIHTAATVSFSSKNLKNLYKVNVEGTANMVNAALMAGVKKFCHVSSVAAIGSPPIGKEESNENNQWDNNAHCTQYAKSKHFAEREVWRGMAEGLSAVIVNPSVVLGYGDWLKSSSQIFKYVWDEKSFYPLGRMNFVDVRDIADACIALLHNENIEGQRFILNGGVIPHKKIFDEIAFRFQKKAPFRPLTPLLSGIAWRVAKIASIFTGKEPQITKDVLLSSRQTHLYQNEKIRKTLNFNFRTLEETLDWACSEYLKNIRSIK